MKFIINYFDCANPKAYDTYTDNLLFQLKLYTLEQTKNWFFVSFQHAQYFHTRIEEHINKI